MRENNEANTNNYGEAMAVYKAMQIASKTNIERVCIYSDSQIVVDAINKYVEKWVLQKKLLTQELEKLLCRIWVRMKESQQ